MTKPLLPIASGSSVVVGDPVSWLPTVGDGVLGRGLGAPGAQEHTDRGLEPCVEPRGRWRSRDARLLPPEIRWLGSGRRGLPVPGIARNGNFMGIHSVRPLDIRSTDLFGQFPNILST
ncbi:hypothetical protein OPV22_000059 [Ensete ventricosum]|uniref:Uncharacterized protein n=1 Tax=Ensete ventricosum TaxID=4639 RepID=A0AAV8RNL7_ENSVE|nr:hypothetical protein OPV22_000059 [Ensete ventricosum]